MENFNTARMMTARLTLGIIVPFNKGIIYLLAWAVVCYLSMAVQSLSVVATIVPTLFPFNNRLLLGNSGHKDYLNNEKISFIGLIKPYSVFVHSVLF